MSRIVAHSGVLLARDVLSAATYWRDVYGFSIDNTFGEPPTFAILKRDEAFVMFGLTASAITPRRDQRESLFDAYFWVDDVRAEYEAQRARGAKVDYEPYRQPYGVLEFGVIDPENYLIGFGQVLAEDVVEGE